MKKEPALKRTPRSPKLVEAIIVFALIIVVIIMTLNFKVGMQTPMVIGCIIAVIFAMILGYSWPDIESSIINGMKSALPTIPILVLVGMLVGIWILGGTIPSIIYYGLKYITPGFLVPLTFIMCAITSVATGTSFGSIATVGLAFFGVGVAMDVPAGIMAGAVASGAFFGDKMSPMSDTTNIAPAMSGCTLYEHIGSMMWTTAPATLICLVIYSIIGAQFSSGTMDLSNVTLIMNTLSENFNISILTLIPPVLVIAMSAFKVPAYKSLCIGVILSAILAMLTQGVDFKAIVASTMSGFKSDTGVAQVDTILTRGGINMMSGTITMLLAATAMGGVLELCEILKTIIGSIMKYIKTYTGLIMATIFGTAATAAASGNMSLTLILPGKTFQPAYEKMDIHGKVLSRTMEDIGTLGLVLIPWTNPAIFLMTTLGVDSSYIPYTFLSLIVPIFSIIFAFTGIAVWHRDGTPIRTRKKAKADA